jgi:hypothetical protein
MLLITLSKSEFDQVLVNVNKLKPYKYIDQVVSKSIVNQASQNFGNM